MLIRLAAVVGLLANGAAYAEYYPSYAQYLGECSNGDLDELERSIARYHDHTDRLAEKFVTGFYRQGARATELQSINLGVLPRFCGHFH
jgi:hypothetical protein